ncbi:telomere repeat-binding factor 4-like [Prosopis cineraria]|uniref:telomere repeat-binding factor 4-like n=1 Tax=Prosopis cineraria TaxID=364024 RepID=UPI00240F3EE7|nr:telomere repeat-binding factor 4-like [Prosopis cineraria]
MGNQKHKWTAEEEEALLAGIGKHGPGKWKNILKDPEFAPFLTHRSNIDLKDKWRNLSVSTAAQGSKEKARNPKIKTTEASTLAGTQNASVAPPLRQCAPSDAATDDSSHNAQDVKHAPQYNGMIFEALSMISDSNGSDLNAIVSFIEQKHEVPQNFRRAVGARLRKLVDQGKLEKVQNCYKIKRATPVETKPPVPKQNDSGSLQPPASGFTASQETEMDAAEIAAYRIAEAEHKSHWAAEAVKEAEKFSKLVEDADAMLKLAKEIYEQCSRGEIILFA